MDQENEIPGVLGLIGKLVNSVSALMNLHPRIDAAGRLHSQKQNVQNSSSHSSLMWVK